MSSLQKSLLSNAIFSSLSGLALILYHSKIAALFNVDSSTVFWIIGIVLIYFSLTIVLEIFKKRPIPILFIIFQDVLWVVGSIILLISNPFDISSTGNLIIAAIAFIVLIMAIAQSLALAKIDMISIDGKKRMLFKRIYSANKSRVWNVVSDVGNVYQVAPNIDHSEILSGSGEGMIRGCSHGKDSWTETCSLWETEKAISFDVHTDKPDYPYPLSFLKGTWLITKISENSTEVQMMFDLKFNHKIQNLLVYPLMKYKFSKLSDKLMDNWKSLIEKRKKD